MPSRTVCRAQHGCEDGASLLIPQTQYLRLALLTYHDFRRRTMIRRCGLDSVSGCFGGKGPAMPQRTLSVSRRVRAGFRRRYRARPPGLCCAARTPTARRAARAEPHRRVVEAVVVAGEHAAV